jgi:hypothetical protein
MTTSMQATAITRSNRELATIQLPSAMNGSDQIVLEAGEGSVSIFGFNAIADKLRLGGSLVGKSISLVTELGSTLVKAGDDLLATIKDVPTGVQKAFVSADIPLYRYQVVDLAGLKQKISPDRGISDCR